MPKKKTVSMGAPVVIHSGLAALKKDDCNKINLTGLIPIESADVDSDFQKTEPNARRWDYYIGLRKHGAIYIEIHKVTEEELQRLIDKATWLRMKIESLGWPMTPDRPLFVAPTAGIELGAVYGDLSRRLALNKIQIIMKGDEVGEIL